MQACRLRGNHESGEKDAWDVLDNQWTMQQNPHFAARRLNQNWCAGVRIYHWEAGGIGQDSESAYEMAYKKSVQMSQMSNGHDWLACTHWPSSR